MSIGHSENSLNVPKGTLPNPSVEEKGEKKEIKTPQFKTHHISVLDAEDEKTPSKLLRSIEHIKEVGKGIKQGAVFLGKSTLNLLGGLAIGLSGARHLHKLPLSNFKKREPEKFFAQTLGTKRLYSIKARAALDKDADYQTSSSYKLGREIGSILPKTINIVCKIVKDSFLILAITLTSITSSIIHLCSWSLETNAADQFLIKSVNECAKDLLMIISSVIVTTVKTLVFASEVIEAHTLTPILSASQKGQDALAKWQHTKRKGKRRFGKRKMDTGAHMKVTAGSWTLSSLVSAALISTHTKSLSSKHKPHLLLEIDDMSNKGGQMQMPIHTGAAKRLPAEKLVTFALDVKGNKSPLARLEQLLKLAEIQSTEIKGKKESQEQKKQLNNCILLCMGVPTKEKLQSQAGEILAIETLSLEYLRTRNSISAEDLIGTLEQGLLKDKTTEEKNELVNALDDISCSNKTFENKKLEIMQHLFTASALPDLPSVFSDPLIPDERQKLNAIANSISEKLEPIRNKARVLTRCIIAKTLTKDKLHETLKKYTQKLPPSIKNERLESLNTALKNLTKQRILSPKMHSFIKKEAAIACVKRFHSGGITPKEKQRIKKFIKNKGLSSFAKNHENLINLKTDLQKSTNTETSQKILISAQKSIGFLQGNVDSLQNADFVSYIKIMTDHFGSVEKINDFDLQLHCLPHNERFKDHYKKLIKQSLKKINSNTLRETLDTFIKSQKDESFISELKKLSKAHLGIKKTKRFVPPISLKKFVKKEAALKAKYQQEQVKEEKGTSLPKTNEKIDKQQAALHKKPTQQIPPHLEIINKALDSKQTLKSFLEEVSKAFSKENSSHQIDSHAYRNLIRAAQTFNHPIQTKTSSQRATLTKRQNLEHTEQIQLFLKNEAKTNKQINQKTKMYLIMASLSYPSITTIK